MKTGVQAFTYDIRTAILPFVFIFNTELLLIGVTSILNGVTIFIVSLIAIFFFTSATQGWLIVRTNVAERIILLVIMFSLFRPDVLLGYIYPEYETVDFDKFVANQVQAPKDRKVRLHSVRETDYGDRFKLYVFRAPGGNSGQKAFGLKIEKEKDGRFAVADLTPNGAAEKVKMDFGDYVTAVEIEQIDRPAKEFVYPIALILLGGVLLIQNGRRKKGVAEGEGA